MNRNNQNNDQRNGGQYNYQTIPPRWLKCPRRGELIAGIINTYFT